MVAKRVIVIGAGFAGLSAASFMAKYGWQVTLLEKHNQPGGRARQLQVNNFTFDMGPSWYWMPQVFERYFEQFNAKVTDFYELIRLDPSYIVHWHNYKLAIPANYEALLAAFESIEPGSSAQLTKFLEEAAYKYEVGINKLVHKPGLSITEFIDWDVIKGVIRLDVFTNMKAHVAKYFKDVRLQQLMEFPVLFLGAMAEQIPALYSLMNYADVKLGTWYPKHGMYQIVKAMEQVAKQQGVTIHYNQAVLSINVHNGVAASVTTANEVYTADAVIAAADYNHVEQYLLQPQWQSYSKAYWNKKLLAPSCLLYYVGLSKRLSNPIHHQLFFDADFGKHAAEIYTSKQWPTNPLFYVSTTTATDVSGAPEGCENLFFLIPIAAGLSGDTEAQRTHYFELILQRFEQKIGESIKDNIIAYQSYGLANFESDYGAYKGNAYGLANTLLQTAILKPKCKSKKVKNLYYSGQLTVPGPGVPPSLISGELVAKLVHNELS